MNRSKLLLLLALASCTSEPVRTHYAVWPFENEAKPHITPRLLAAAPGALCPHPERVERTRLFQAILGSISWAESEWDPHIKPYVETSLGIDPVTHQAVLSQGLFQLSYQDAVDTNYRDLAHCARISFATKNIEELDVNVGCALEIMDRLVARHPGADLSEALHPYWSTMNPHKSGYPRTLAKLKQLVPECF